MPFYEEALRRDPSDLRVNTVVGIRLARQAKFAEAELDVFEGEKEQLQIKLNPGGDYVIKENEAAFVIGDQAG